MIDEFPYLSADEIEANIVAAAQVWNAQSEYAEFVFAGWTSTQSLPEYSWMSPCGQASWALIRAGTVDTSSFCEANQNTIAFVNGRCGEERPEMTFCTDNALALVGDQTEFDYVGQPIRNARDPGYINSWNGCSVDSKCPEFLGDCDHDGECEAGLACTHNVGHLLRLRVGESRCLSLKPVPINRHRRSRCGNTRIRALL